MSHSELPKHPTSEVDRLARFYRELAERCDALTEENIALRAVIEDNTALMEENQRLLHDNVELRRRHATSRTNLVQRLAPLRELSLMNFDDDDL